MFIIKVPGRFATATYIGRTEDTTELMEEALSFVTHKAALEFIKFGFLIKQSPTMYTTTYPSFEILEVEEMWEAKADGVIWCSHKDVNAFRSEMWDHFPKPHQELLIYRKVSLKEAPIQNPCTEVSLPKTRISAVDKPSFDISNIRFTTQGLRMVEVHTTAEEIRNSTDKLELALPKLLAPGVAAHLGTQGNLYIEKGNLTISAGVLRYRD